MFNESVIVILKMVSFINLYTYHCESCSHNARSGWLLEAGLHFCFWVLPESPNNI